ncbi:MAG: response regulator [Phycisphaera sp.]|nr:response regulator [Phycisphaera sp.]
MRRRVACGGVEVKDRGCDRGWRRAMERSVTLSANPSRKDSRAVNGSGDNPADRPSGEEGVAVLCARAAGALRAQSGALWCQVLLWEGPKAESERGWRCDELGTTEAGPPGPHEGGDASRRCVLELPLGPFGRVLLGFGAHGPTGSARKALARAADELAELLSERLPAAELASAMRWLRARNEVDRTIARGFAAVRTLEELGRTIAAVSDELFVVEYSGIYFLDPDTGRLRLVGAKGLDEHERRAAEETAEDRHPGFVLRTGQVVDIPDTARAAPEFGAGLSSHGKTVRSRLYLPVQVDGVVVGTVGFASEHLANFTPRHREGLSFLADFAGLTYARLVAARENERRGALIVASHEAGARVLAALDWREVATAVLALLGDALDAGALALIELPHGSAEGAVPSAAAREFVWQPFFGEPWTLGSAVREAARAEGEALSAGHGVEVALGDARSRILLEPVVVEGTLWGVLSFERRRSSLREADHAERSALRGLASAFAIAIARERLEASLRQRQRMEAVGMLASGLARDFNNVLWPIILYTEMLDSGVALDARMRQMLHEIQSSARAASDIVQQVLALSLPRDRAVELVPVPRIAEECAAILARTVPATVSLETAIESDAGSVLADGGAIHQAIINLVTHAVESLAGRTGKVRLSAERAHHAGHRAVRIVVRGGSDGASAGVGPFVHFDPYAAAATAHAPRTQASASLGLGIVHRVVTEMRGRMLVAEGEHGAITLEVTLPAADGQAPAAEVGTPAAEVGTPAAEVGTPAAVSTRERSGGAAKTAKSVILVVDDDAAVLGVMQTLLSALGHEVLAASSPREALDTLASRAGAVDLLVTDLTMPVMTGIELAEEARRRSPSLRVVCCTGYGDERAERMAKAAGISAFLRKPVDLDTLEETVRTELGVAAAARR